MKVSATWMLLLVVWIGTVACMPPLNASPCEIATYWGYNCTDHDVVTSDGYILSLQRIAPRNTVRDHTVFLQHGLLDSSVTWMVNLPSECLSFMLADAGYTVWLGNTRGNRYSNSNTGLSNSSDAFWAFSWDEMAAYDLPAMLDYVLEHESQRNLSYVGHSQGTMIGFAGFEHAEIAAKVDLFIALAPVAYVGHLQLEAYHLLAKLPESVLFGVLGHRSVLYTPEEINDFVGLICRYLPSSCEGTICLLAGCESPHNVNETVLPFLMAHFPAGTSTQNLMHYAQGTKNDLFEKYDFGTNGNNAHYGQPTPPQYDASKVHLPVALFSGGLDRLADPADVTHLASQLPNIRQHITIPDFGHGDFVWAKNANTVIYQPIIDMLRSL